MSPPHQPDPGMPWQGRWPPQPAPPRRRSRATVAWTVAGSLGGLALLALIAVGGFRLGSSGDLWLPAPTATSPPADWTGVGDDPGLDAYAQRCHDGELDACDDLYTLSDPGSDYEYYALTCGGRVAARDTTLCVLLD